MCVRVACGFALDLLVICEGFVALAAATAAHAQAWAIDVLEMCFGICFGFACDL